MRFYGSCAKMSVVVVIGLVFLSPESVKIMDEFS